MLPLFRRPLLLVPKHHVGMTEAANRHRCSSSSSSTTNNSNNNNKNNNNNKATTIYLHIGPSGDCWTGEALAGKQLPPDYVKSIPLLDTTTESSSYTTLLDEDTIVSLVEADGALRSLIYDRGSLDYAVLHQKLLAEQHQREEAAAAAGGTKGKHSSSSSSP
jgi:hypothetical protein